MLPFSAHDNNPWENQTNSTRVDNGVDFYESYLQTQNQTWLETRVASMNIYLDYLSYCICEKFN